MVKIKISYDYEELLYEINEEIEDGVLSLEDEIQILRGEGLSNKELEHRLEWFRSQGVVNPVLEEYHPIIDWYYDDNSMNEIFEIEPDYDEEEIKEAEEIKVSYLKDKPFLITKKVKEVLEEMKEKNKII